jgi:hypothetical protein
MKTKVNFAQLTVLTVILALGISVIAHIIQNNITY